MPWSEGSDNLLLVIDGALAEIDCGTDHGQPGIVVPARRNGSREFGALVLGHVGATLLHDCWRIGPGNVEARA